MIFVLLIFFLKRLPSFSIRRPVTIIMIFCAVLLLGLIAWPRLPQELYPPISYPQLTVVTHYKDAAPEEIEILVTKPIEEVIGTVSGVRRLNSISKEEVAIVIAEFNWGTNMDFAALGVREKLDLIKERLPRGSEDPVVIKYNPFDAPVLVLNLSGEMSPHDLLELARKRIKNDLEKVEGVAAVNISGGLEREILIAVDQGRLQASGMPISQVVESVSKANLNYPAGTIKEAFYEYLIRTMGEFRVVPEISGVAVGVEETKGATSRRPAESSDHPSPLKREKGTAPPQRMILLKDIATVEDTFKERSSVSRFNGKENISLRIQKQAGGNTLQIATKAKEVIDRIRTTLPPGMDLTVANDQSLFIRSAIAGVRDAAIQGGVLAFLLLYLFLGNPWAALNVSFAIPISVFATIGFMYFGGTTINIISMAGLALSVGLLVDAGIVVVESIDRYRDQGKLPKEAALRGTEEVVGAVAGSILTNIVVFLPMIFVVASVVGQLLKDLAYTVVVSNFLSLFVSVTLTTLFASWIRKGAGRSPIDPIIESYSRFDTKIVLWFLKNRFLGIGLVFLLFLGSIAVLGSLDREVLPKADQGQFTLKVNLPPGTRLEMTDRISQRIEQVLTATPEVKNITVTIGSSKDKKAEELLETLGSHQAQIFVTLKPKYRGFGKPHDSEFRTRTTAAVVQELKDTLNREHLEGAEIEYLLEDSALKSSFLGSTPVVVEVKGTDLPKLEQLSNQVRKLLEKTSGLYGIQTSLTPPSPETKVHINKDRAGTYHLSVSDIALTAQTAVKGFVASKFKEEGKEIDIRVRLRKQDREDLNKVRHLLVHSPLDLDIPLSEVAYFSVGHGPTEIRHLDQQRTILVSAQLFQRPLNEVLQEISVGLKEIQVPMEYTLALTGENEQMRESFRSLAFALILAVVLIYMVMACQFESLWQPAIIMGTIPMSLIGVAFGLWVTRTPVGVMVAIGFIFLGGIIVNNGIVLVDYANLLRSQGMSTEEAVVKASQVRLRPILMTAAAEVLGLLPLALGLQEGVELQKPMAITQIWGMIVGTFLTPIFLPTLYVAGDAFFSKFRRARVQPLEMVPALAGSSLPDIPEDFGNEEVAPERGDFPFFFSPPSLPPVQPPLAPPTPAEVPAVVPGTILEKAPGSRLLLEETALLSPPASLNSRQQQVLDYLKIHGKISRVELVQLTGASVPTAARDLKNLVDRGLIHGVGPLARGRYYVLVEPHEPRPPQYN